MVTMVVASLHNAGLRGVGGIHGLAHFPKRVGAGRGGGNPAHDAAEYARATPHCGPAHALYAREYRSRAGHGDQPASQFPIYADPGIQADTVSDLTHP